MKAFCANVGGEFISIKFRTFCKKKDITFKYAVLYIHKKNGFSKKRWQIIITMKDLLLLDSGFPLDFWVKVMDTAN